jgi:hypothetical protein
MPYQHLADIVLTLHFALVVFVVAGLVLVIVGNFGGWQWVNRLWFRLAHLLAIAVVVAESWFGWVCPLTTLEIWLRAKAGAPGYTTGFIEHWLQQALYYDAPAWAFTVTYSLFGLAVLATWWYFPPARQHSHHQQNR